jgi:hypothetical protein
MSVAETATGAALDLSILLGDWLNTNAAGSIARIICEPFGEGRMTVHCYGRAARDIDWGLVDAPVYAFAFDGKQAGAFSAVVDLGFEEVRLQANVKAGVLVVATFNRFRDGSGRSNYFQREFFYRTKR